MRGSFLTFLLVGALALAPAMASGIVGGWSTQEGGSLADPELKKAVDFVTTSANTQNGLLTEKQGTLKFEQLKSVSTQVVAGFNYKLVVDLADTATGKTYEVKATVWSRPWLEHKNADEPALQMTSFEYSAVDGDTA